MAKLSAVDVTKDFVTADGQLVEALGPVSLELNEGEFAAIIGRSGCGKTTLFNILAGLTMPTRGHVLLEHHEVTGRPGVVAYQLQKDLLLPWRTILENVVLGPEIRRVGKPAARRDALRLLNDYGLGDFAERYPSQLSGGMRQRAAFLRTLLYDRDVVLLDEPFGALDAQTRVSMQTWLLQVWQAHRKTVLLTTHDVEEAVFLADRVYVMGPRPGTMVRDVRVPLERPRRRAQLASAEIVELKEQLFDALEAMPSR